MARIARFTTTTRDDDDDEEEEEEEVVADPGQGYNKPVSQSSDRGWSVMCSAIIEIDSRITIRPTADSLTNSVACGIIGFGQCLAAGREERTCRTTY